MKVGLFYEHQLPRPWTDDGEHRLMKDALEQVELADRLGFDHVWAVEHHFLEEYSHSSAPEVFLAACSQRTTNIRLGHGIVQLPHTFNHPVRVAERIATLDLLSDGRVEFGTGESSSEAELGGFGIARSEKRDQWAEALDAVTRMFVEEPFAGYDGRWLRMPPRNIVPKPLQKPHPPLWVACSKRETIHLAATRGLGALSFAFLEPDEARHWVDDYYSTIASNDCVPAGFSVNANLAIVAPFMCHRDEETAVERGSDGGSFFGYALAHYYVFGDHLPGRTDIWSEFEERRDPFGFGPNGPRRGAVGTPAQLRGLLVQYEEIGVDEVIFIAQAGRNRHEHICEALELFAAEVLPELAEHEAAREAAKRERLAGTIDAALARREPARDVDPAYHVEAAPRRGEDFF